MGTLALSIRLGVGLEGSPGVAGGGGKVCGKSFQEIFPKSDKRKADEPRYKKWGLL
jgi:hypothetical protein